MKKLTKSLGALALIFIFTFGITNEAEAKFWGKESDEIVAYEDGTMCTTTHTYRFWIKVSSETTCGACC